MDCHDPSGLAMTVTGYISLYPFTPAFYFSTKENLMLNRIKKNLIIAFAGVCLCLPAFAVDSTISYITINDMAYQDVEIVVT